jgi:hypothetical protein
MYEEPFEVMALDANFEIVSLISYANLQWTRKFHEVGSFSIQLRGRQYDSSWKYIYSKARKELGIISQVNWQKKNYIELVTISGLFVESEVNNMIVYPLPTKFYDDTITIEQGKEGTCLLKNQGLPTWLNQSGTADVVARNFFEGFKKIAWTNYQINDYQGNNLVTTVRELDINFGNIDTQHGDYHYSEHNRNKEKLGNKLYKILKPSGASFEVIWNYDTHDKTLNIIHGKDLTQGNTDGNNPVVFSSANGNIISASLVISDTNTKDTIIQTSENKDKVYVLINELPNASGRFEHVGMQTAVQDYFNDDTQDYTLADKQLKLAVMQDSDQELNKYTDKQNIEFQIYRGSYKYMEDYDLGDLISVEINEIGLSLNARIISCYEVVKQGVWELTLEIGTPLIKSFGNVKK